MSNYAPKPTRKRSTQPDIVLNIEGSFNDFTDFYDGNKEVIYKNILDLFELLRTTRKKKLTLSVVAKIRGLEWDTDFTFSKDDKETLLRDVMPYFEQVEDYEVCSKIIKLHKDLTI
jgi:hypothetical protein